jgi:hypothetical protein
MDPFAGRFIPGKRLIFPTIEQPPSVTGDGRSGKGSREFLGSIRIREVEDGRGGSAPGSVPERRRCGATAAQSVKLAQKTAFLARWPPFFLVFCLFLGLHFPLNRL